MWYETKSVWISSGDATGSTKLNAFDNAMRAAKIADFNIIRVTSIIPPGVPVNEMPSTAELIKGRGLMLPAVYEAIESEEEGAEISAGVAIGIPPVNSQNAGVIFTYSAYDSEDVVRGTLRTMIEEGMSEMRLVPEYEFISAIASTTVGSVPTCVFATAAFCDPHLEPLFEEALP